MSQGSSDLAEILRQLLEYVRDKYQIPDFASYVSLVLILDAFEEKFGYKPIDLAVFEKTIHAPSFVEPLWIKALRELSKINTQTTIVQEIFSRKRLQSLTE